MPEYFLFSYLLGLDPQPPDGIEEALAVLDVLLPGANCVGHVASAVCVRSPWSLLRASLREPVIEAIELRMSSPRPGSRMVKTLGTRAGAAVARSQARHSSSSEGFTQSGS